jgi:hypothetical protein
MKLIKPSNSKTIKDINDYLVGMLVGKWVFIIGFSITQLFILIFIQGKQRINIFTPFIRDSLSIFSPFTLWLIGFLFIFINYSLGFILKKRYPTLDLIFAVFSTMFILVTLMIILPLVEEILRSS